MVFTKEVVSGSREGKRLMGVLLQGISQMLQDKDYNEAINRFNQELEQVTDKIDDDDLRDFLGDIGIRFSDDDDGPQGPSV